MCRDSVICIKHTPVCSQRASQVGRCLWTLSGFNPVATLHLAGEPSSSFSFSPVTSLGCSKSTNSVVSFLNLSGGESSRSETEHQDHFHISVNVIKDVDVHRSPTPSATRCGSPLVFCFDAVNLFLSVCVTLSFSNALYFFFFKPCTSCAFNIVRLV